MPPKSLIKKRRLKSSLRKPRRTAKGRTKKPVRKPKRKPRRTSKSSAKRRTKKPIRKPKKTSKRISKRTAKGRTKKAVRKPKRISKRISKHRTKKPVRKPKRRSKRISKRRVKKAPRKTPSRRTPKRRAKKPLQSPRRRSTKKLVRNPKRKLTKKDKEYRPPENRDFMNVNSYKQYEKDVEDYKMKRREFKNNKEVLKTLNWPDIHLYMTPREIKRHREALLEYNKNYRQMTQTKVQFVLKVGLEPLENIKVNKKEVSDKVTKGLVDKKSRLWDIVTGSYFEIVDIIKEEYIGDKKVRITVLVHQADPKRYIQDIYGALAADGWQEGDIVLRDKYEVTLTLVSVKILK